ncbi:gas vesicle protein GvpA/GvpJ/GvpM family [Streptomyces sp. BK022]|uniref:gas vesicle protein n=1 Tax=Streptomyces sp. BK022 TaxID=2512123 RepID=UPI0010D9C79C|nr:gas vesicle protein [Streptomyces sp. BK022]RZU45651.1 gas vesicle protein GvpA/GvpJ/GvpM family [Streptomyces sp. BK022]
MSEPLGNRLGPTPSRAAQPYGQGSSANLADILERVLDKGIVIAGDIQINLLDIELLTIKLRLLVASVDKAKEMGIDWWEHDPSLSSRARGDEHSLAEENRRLRAELAALREPEELLEVEPEEYTEEEEEEEEPEEEEVEDAEVEEVEEEEPEPEPEPAPRPARRRKRSRDE